MRGLDSVLQDIVHRAMHLICAAARKEVVFGIS